jgi:hypothetical protein
MNNLRMQTSNKRKSSSSLKPTGLRRAQSLPNALDREAVGTPLFWFKAPKRKIANDSKPPRRRLPQLPRLGRLPARKMSPSADWQILDSITLKPSMSSDTDVTPETIDSTETSDTIDDDTWSTYSTDDENETSYLHGLSFLDETDENGINDADSIL